MNRLMKVMLVMTMMVMMMMMVLVMLCDNYNDPEDGDYTEWWPYLQHEFAECGEVLALPAVEYALHLLDAHCMLVLPLHLIDVARHAGHARQRLRDHMVLLVVLLKTTHNILKNETKIG